MPRTEGRITFVGAALVLALVLVGVVTFALARRAVRIEARRVGVLKTLNAIDAAEAQLARDVLLTRIGPQPSSGTLAADCAALRTGIRRLADLSPRGDPPVQSAEWRAEGKIELAERLASSDAEIRTELASFDALDNRLAAAAVDPDVRAGLSRVEAAIRGLLRMRDPDLRRRADGQIDALAALWPAAPEQRNDLDAFTRQARHVVDLLPKADEFAEEATSLSLAPLLAQMRDVMRSERLREQHHVALLLAGLYGLAALVGMALVGTRHALSRQTQALREMVAVEHIAARASNLFITCGDDEIEEQFVEVLGLLGHACGLDRVYILDTENADALWTWHRDGTERPEGWPLALRDELEGIAAAATNIVRVPEDRFHPSPSLAVRLAKAGIHGWTCAKVKGAGKTVGLLCFERSASRASGFVETEDALAMLTDVIGHAFMRRELHQRYRTLEARLRRSERLEALGTFASGIAHNFNNVLGVIAGQVELAAERLGDDAPLLAHVQKIGQAGDRARELVDEILAFGRPERSHPRVLPVAAVVAEAVAHVGLMLPDASQLVVIGGNATGATLASEAQLHQVFVNLIQNAVQASPAGARVTIALDAVAGGAATLSHGDLAPGAYTRIVVTDQGEGMTPATLAKLFQPFFSTKPSGTGLGLATALETVRRAGGGIEVQSTPGRGSRFEVWLPQVGPGAESSAAGASALSVLLLNPDPGTLPQDEELVAALGYEPVGFANPDAALQMLTAAPNRYDAMIIEHKLSHWWTGLQFVHAARTALSPEMPIVLSTASVDVDLVTLTRIGVTGVVRRPWQTSALADALQITRSLHQARVRPGGVQAITV